MKQTLAASGVFLLFLFFGGLWVSLSRILPDGISQSISIVAFGAVFVMAFVWLLISRVRAILGGTEHFLREGLLALFNLSLLVLAFAAMYQKLGIIDNTTEGSPTIHVFSTCIYYSVVTFTTLGYGDFYPVGIGRILAAMESFTGYIILGVLASTAASVLSPQEEPGFSKEE